jgi:signal transduction histidine kinase
MKMYFMITELLNNIMKHSEASKAKLTLIENDNQLTVTVADNGNGLRRMMKAMIEVLSHQIRQLVVSTGKLLLNQAQKKGTTITISTLLNIKKLTAFSNSIISSSFILSVNIKAQHGSYL